MDVHAKADFSPPGGATKAIEISLITEAYNFSEGQSLAALFAALQMLAACSDGYPDREALLIDASGDARIAAMAQRHFPRVRHLHCALNGYEQIKQFAAEQARGRIVAYLDGDCMPSYANWLEKLTAPIRAGQAIATCGTTVYRGDTVLGALTSVMDFGFVTESKGGPIGCYPSNNVAFLRAKRLAIPVPGGALRCRCYAHAQELMRRGQPVVHVPEALVVHEPPPLLAERYRRGYDLVAACWADPRLSQARWLRWSVAAAPLFYAQALLGDWRRLGPDMVPKSTARRRLLARLLAPWLRLIDLGGIVRALALGPSRRWLGQ